MSLFGRNRTIWVSYDEKKVDPADFAALREEMAKTFREEPETYRGRKKLTIITTNIKIKRQIRKKKKALKKERKKETPIETLQSLEQEIEKLEQEVNAK